MNGITCLVERDPLTRERACQPRRRPARAWPRGPAPILAAAMGAAALALGSVCARADNTQVYKTVDAQGNVVYSDRASSMNTSRTAVAVHEPSAEDLKALEKSRKASEAAEVQRLQDALSSHATQTQAAEQQKNKQAACEHARTYFYSLRDATRLYQRDAQGNPVYLPDEAADAKRAEAHKAMDAACTP
jgi:Domain of unknown function (DUF4124)